MITWALIPCSMSKQKFACAVREMYRPSAQFRGAWEAAERNGQQILILSAKHGLLHPDAVIEPYDETLAGATRRRRHEWTMNLFYGPAPRITDVIQPGDHVVSYLGADYSQFLVPWLRQSGVTVEEPLKGLSQGARLKWFKERRLAAC